MKDKEQREKRKAYAKAYNAKTKEKRKAYLKKWFDENRDHIREKQRSPEYKKSRRLRYENDEVFRLSCQMRVWLNDSLKRKGESKTAWIDHIGCTKEEFKAHIESQFVEGMSWYNWTVDGWHMDHIRPLSKGGSNHYTNIQPLWAKDNLSKSDKIV